MPFLLPNHSVNALNALMRNDIETQKYRQDLKHEPEFWLALGLVAELVDEDAGQVETARVRMCLIQLYDLIDAHRTHHSHSTRCLLTYMIRLPFDGRSTAYQRL